MLGLNIFLKDSKLGEGEKHKEMCLYLVWMPVGPWRALGALPQGQKSKISRSTAVYLRLLRFPNRTQTCKSTERPGQAWNQLMDQVNFLGGRGSWLSKTFD